MAGAFFKKYALVFTVDKLARADIFREICWRFIETTIF